MWRQTRTYILGNEGGVGEGGGSLGGNKCQHGDKRFHY